MIIDKVSVDTLLLDPSNARKHDEKNLAAIKGSLVKFGQQTDNFFKRVHPSDQGCWIFEKTQSHTGYGKFGTSKETWRAHRWIMHKLGKIDRHDKRCVLHKCDNRACVNPSHLYLGDRYQNAQDIKSRGRTHLIRDPKLGSRNPQSKLSEDQVREIRDRLLAGEKGKDIAFRFKISKVTISQIKHRKVWGHL